VVVSHFDALGIPAAAPEQASHLQGIFDGERRECRILDVEEIQPLPEYLRFVVFLYAEALPRVQASNTWYRFRSATCAFTARRALMLNGSRPS
jgi:hypothetical protein